MAGQNTRKKKNTGGRLVFIVVLAVLLAVIYKVGYSRPSSKDKPSGTDTELIYENPETVAAEPEAEDEANQPDGEEISEEPVRDAFYESLSESDKIIYDFAKDHGLTLGHYPRSIRDKLAKNPEAEEFVLNYPFLKDVEVDYTIPEYDDLSNGIPLLIQWDSRWGYHKYGSDVMGLTACGPTVLSMVVMYFRQDTTYDPIYMADWSEENGYYYPGSGTMWIFMTEGARQFGIDGEELPLDRGVMINYLEQGKPIVMSMGPGVFTTEGHFILVTGYEDGKFKINDPNSYIRSEKLWDYYEFEDQVSNLWAMSPMY